MPFYSMDRIYVFQTMANYSCVLLLPHLSSYGKRHISNKSDILRLRSIEKKQFKRQGMPFQAWP